MGGWSSFTGWVRSSRTWSTASLQPGARLLPQEDSGTLDFNIGLRPHTHTHTLTRSAELTATQISITLQTYLKRAGQVVPTKRRVIAWATHSSFLFCRSASCFPYRHSCQSDCVREEDGAGGSQWHFPWKTEESGLQRWQRLDTISKQPFQLLQSPAPTLEQLHQASARQEGVKKPDSRFLSENHYMQGAVSTPLLLWSTCGQQASVRTSLWSLVGLRQEGLKQVPGHSAVVGKEGRQEGAHCWNYYKTQPKIKVGAPEGARRHIRHPVKLQTSGARVW